MVVKYEDSRVFSLSEDGTIEANFTKALSPEALATLSRYRRTARFNWSPLSLLFRVPARLLAGSAEAWSKAETSPVRELLTTPNFISFLGLLPAAVAVIVSLFIHSSAAGGLVTALLLLTRFSDSLDGAMASRFVTVDALGFITDCYTDALAMIAYATCLPWFRASRFQLSFAFPYCALVSMFLWLPALATTAEALLRRATVLSTAQHLVEDVLVFIPLIDSVWSIPPGYFYWALLPPLALVYVISAVYFVVATVRGARLKRQEAREASEAAPAVVGTDDEHEAHTRPSALQTVIENVVPISGEDSMKIGLGYLGTCLFVLIFMGLIPLQRNAAAWPRSFASLTAVAPLALVRASVAVVSGHVTPAIQPIHGFLLLALVLSIIGSRFPSVASLSGLLRAATIVGWMTSAWMMIWTMGAVTQHSHMSQPFAHAPDRIS